MPSIVTYKVCEQLKSGRSQLRNTVPLRPIDKAVESCTPEKDDDFNGTALKSIKWPISCSGYLRNKVSGVGHGIHL
jgi:hypothetical protein